MSKTKKIQTDLPPTFKPPKTYRRITKRNERFSILQILGFILLCAGILILLICACISIGAADAGKEYSPLAAIGFFNIMLGVALIYPDMLEGSSGSLSSMRVAVFMIISVFVVLVVKAGWGTSNLETFTLDRSWAYIIGIALGGKAAQYFGEKLFSNSSSTGSASGTDTARPAYLESLRWRKKLGTEVFPPQPSGAAVPDVPPQHIQNASKNQLK